MSRQKPDLPKQRKPCGLPSEESTSSFWHSQPSALLTGHRSTRHLPETADVVVVGSGMTGASVAYNLLTDDNGTVKPAVVMLEAREACWGATGRNGGHCQPILFEHPNDLSIARFEIANFHALQDLIEKHDIDCEFVAQPGCRGIYSRHHLDQAESALLVIKSTSPELASMMRLVTDSDELAALRIPTAMGAVVTSIAARMWPYKLVSRVLEHLIKNTKLHGTFNLQTLTPVVQLTPQTSGVKVETDRGSIMAKKVILATNAYTSHLLHKFADLIVPCRGQMSALVPFPSVSGKERLKTSLGLLGDGMDDYLIQRPNERGGHLMFGGGRQTGPSLGVTDDNVIDDQTSEYLRTKLISVLNLPEGFEKGAGGKEHWKEMNATHMWSGIMGFSRDDVPWVGSVPETHGSVFMAAGFTGHGMPNTWLSGKAVAFTVRHVLEGTNDDEAVQMAADAVGLPKAYHLTKERMAKAMDVEDVETKDWAEMDRGRKAAQSPSGYA